MSCGVVTMLDVAVVVVSVLVAVVLSLVVVVLSFCSLEPHELTIKASEMQKSAGNLNLFMIFRF